MDALQRYGDVARWSSAGARGSGSATVTSRPTSIGPHRLAEGASLSEVTAEITAAWGLGLRLLPMTDDRVETRGGRRRRG